MTREQEQIIVQMLSHLHESAGWYERIPLHTGDYFCRYCLGGGPTKAGVDHQRECMIALSKQLAQTMNR